METTIFDLLTPILGAELSIDLAGYIVTIENPNDFDDYLNGLLDLSIKQQRDIFEKIKSVKFSNTNNNRSKSKNTGNNNTSNNQIKESPEQSTSDPGKKQKQQKKYKKFQLSEIHKGYLKEGRNPCECQATKHKLINNCLECGRIVCEQEGSGPCFFCDNMVCTPEEEAVLKSDTKQADQLYRTLTERKKSDTWKKAMQNRDKLLEYDRNNTKQTKIIDDEHDYFSVTNTWSSKKDREKAAKRLEQEHEHKYGSRLGARKIAFDLLGRQAYEENTFTYQEEVDDEQSSPVSEKRRSFEPHIPDIDSVLNALRNEKSNYKHKKEGILDEHLSENQKLMKNYIIQDKAYLEMNDKGMCLSMHQPWASLLVLGIKKHEGRTWYTPHRGTLWIAATGQTPEPEIIKEVENFYMKYYEGLTIKFPKKYPTGVLLGNVLVQDCQGQDEYREEYPNGESESPYVFICSDPNKLVVPIPVKGSHKIWRLKSELHVMAKDALLLKKRFAK